MDGSYLLPQAMQGFEAYLFKFSITSSNNGGVVKSGIHWGDNTVYPYPIGDTTLTTEAVRLIVSSMVGNKTMVRHIVAAQWRGDRAPGPQWRLCR